MTKEIDRRALSGEERSKAVHYILDLNEESALPINGLIQSFAVNLIQETLYFIAREIQQNPAEAFKILYPKSIKRHQEKFDALKKL